MSKFKSELGDKKKFENLLKDCVDKVEGISDKDWQDLVEEYDLNIHRDVLRKQFAAAPMGGYFMYKYMNDRDIEKQPKNKMQEIKDLLGEDYIIKQETKNKLNQINRIKREFVKSIEIANDINDFLIEDQKDYIPYFDYDPVEHSNNKIIVNIGDLHVGYVINGYKGNYYNYNILLKRLEKVTQEVKRYCELYDVTDVIVCNLGDVVENAYMRRTNQAYTCEFNFSQQIVKAEKAIFRFLNTISDFANVEFYSVGGNHNRITQKDENIEGDNINVIINENLKTLVEISNNSRITINDVDYLEDCAEFKVNNTRVKIFHGDNRPKEDKKIADNNYDLIIRGHYHAFSTSKQNNCQVVTNGCTFGFNPYSAKMGYETPASQSLIVINEEEIECIKEINLQNIK